MGGPLLDAAGKGDGIRPSFHQLSGPQHCFFTRAASAAGEAHDFDLLFHLGKSPHMKPGRLKVRRTRTIIFGLHASNDSQFHGVSSFDLLCFPVFLSYHRPISKGKNFYPFSAFSVFSTDTMDKGLFSSSFPR